MYCTSLGISLHLKLMNDKHDLGLAVVRMDVPLTGEVYKVFVWVIRRANVTATHPREVFDATCTSMNASCNSRRNLTIF